MRDTTLTIEQMQEQAKRDRETILEGVSRKALEVLKRRVGFDLPVFQRVNMHGEAYNDEQFIREALIRDGQREVICYIERCLNVSHD